MEGDSQTSTPLSPYRKGMVNLVYHSFWGFVNILEKDRYAMFTEQITQTIDDNNTKALSITQLLIVAMENSLEGFDAISNLEVIRDYLRTNYMIFDKQGV